MSLRVRFCSVPIAPPEAPAPVAYRPAMSSVPEPFAAPRGLVHRLGLIAGDIKLAHSVFAMPFALLGAALALRPGASPGRTVALIALVVACMVLARTWAMLVNRLADRVLDAENPRTATRVFARGLMSPCEGWGVALGIAAGFVAMTSAFWFALGNPWPLALSLPVLAWIAFYSFTKRFTLWCHAFLGGALAVSPLCAAVAVRAGALTDTPALWWLSAMVLCWVAGFDVIYALQDADFDRRRGLHSIPARLGTRGAVLASRGLHVLAGAALIGAALAEPRFGPVFALATTLVFVLLIAEHAVLARRGEAGLNMAFFTLNGVVSVVLGAAGIADLVV